MKWIEGETVGLWETSDSIKIKKNKIEKIDENTNND